jgi:hypothetical protein
VSEGGRIFISYRRQESSHVAGRLYDRLSSYFGEGLVFIDVDMIKPGVDFMQAINDSLSTCDVLLAIIGPHWLSATDELGHRRLEAPNDIVRIEIEAALTRKVRIIPILVENAAMPTRHDLPDSLASFVRHNALVVRHETFRQDTERLVAAIEDILLVHSQAQSEKTSQPKSDLKERSTQREKWRLKLVASAGTKNTFHLSSDREVHEIAVTLSFSGDIIEVDGICVVNVSGIDGRIIRLGSLSADLGSDVIIKVQTGALWPLKMRRMFLKIADQTLVYDSKFRLPDLAVITRHRNSF